MGYLLLPILLILMYLMLLRPQQQRLKNQRQLVASLDVGDDIVTAGGIIGRIVELSDERATVEVADGVTIDFLRAAISRKIDDGYAVGQDDEPVEEDIDLDTETDAEAPGPEAATHPDRTDEESR
jgi:preprotein translocase subunit YajC